MEISMKKKKIKNPLIRRIPRELTGDWKKYLVVSLFLILMIGFVSGMYVANESMMTAADEGVGRYKLEDGHFELKKKADETLLDAIKTGDKADVRQYYIDEAKKKLDKKSSFFHLFSCLSIFKDEHCKNNLYLGKFQQLLSQKMNQNDCSHCHHYQLKLLRMDLELLLLVSQMFQL